MYFEKLSDDVFLSINFKKFLSEQTRNNIAGCLKCFECKEDVIKHLCIMLQVLYEQNIAHKLLTKKPLCECLL